ncbi:MAG TPA: hypothetical protein DIW47_07010 [Bacteroidetes bacterium]|nr:hypothetical protein [Bacteroidota bacterium]
MTYQRKFIGFLVYYLLVISPAFSQWSACPDFPSATDGAFSMVINGKAYVNAGLVSGNDFYSYDETNNQWTKLADVPSTGSVRTWAFSFVVNGKGYVAGGSYETASDLEKSLWEYSPATNTWTQKADFPGGPRDGGFSFSIGNKGYIGGGFDGQYLHNDLYEYDPLLDKWTLLAPFPGGPVIFPASFVIDGKAYVGTGDQGGVEIQKFWEYNPTNNTWTKKADFAGEKRQTAIGFSIGDKGYIGGGMSGYSINRQDFWEYDPQADSWTKLANADLSDEHTAWSTGFVIGNTVYYGLGVKFPEFSYSKKFFKRSFSGPNGFKENELIDKLRIYPNPARALVNIESEGVIIHKITLCDMKGQTLNSWEGEHRELNTAGVLPGVYFLNMETDKGIRREKLILTQ